MRKRIFSISICFLVFSFLLTLNFSCKKEEEITQAEEKINITVAHWGHAKILIYLPLYIAIDGGFFEKKGIEARIKYSGNDDQVFASVIKGEAQFGVGDPTFTAISRERGFPGKVIATLVGGLANWGVTKRDDLKMITDPQDLEGLKIGSFPAPSTTFTILTDIIKKYNLTNTKIIEAPIGTELALLESGEADIVIQLEPGASIAENRGYRIVWSVPQFYGPFTLTGVTTSETFINNNREMVQKFVNAIENALDFCHSNFTSTVEIASKNFPELEKIIVENAVERMLDDKTIPKHSLILEDAWRKTISIRHEVGDLKSIEAGLSAVDNSFAQNALKKK